MRKDKRENENDSGKKKDKQEPWKGDIKLKGSGTAKTKPKDRA